MKGITKFTSGEEFIVMENISIISDLHPTSLFFLIKTERDEGVGNFKKIEIGYVTLFAILLKS